MSSFEFPLDFTGKASTPITLALGAFCLFALVGFIADIEHLGQQPVSRLVLSVLFGGLFAASLVLLGYNLRRKPLWLRIVVMVLYLVIGNAVFGTLFFATIPDLPQTAQVSASDIAKIKQRLTNNAIAINVGIVLSYIFFGYAVTTEGRRRLRAQTEIDLAATLHRALVPPIDTKIGAFEFYGRSIPSGEVGGDLVDVYEDENGWIAYVADVSGHGVAPGVVMAMVKSAVRMRLSSNHNNESILSSLNSVLYSVTTPEMFVTFAYVASNGSGLEFSTAAHPTILHYRACDKDFCEISCSNLPLGMFDRQSFVKTTAHFSPGDLILLLTDGLLEVASSEGEEFGLDNVKRLVSQHASAPMSQLFDALLSAAKDHGQANDDQSLLLIRCG